MRKMLLPVAMILGLLVSSGNVSAVPVPAKLSVMLSGNKVVKFPVTSTKTGCGTPGAGDCNNNRPTNVCSTQPQKIELADVSKVPAPVIPIVQVSSGAAVVVDENSLQQSKKLVATLNRGSWNLKDPTTCPNEVIDTINWIVVGGK